MEQRKAKQLGMKLERLAVDSDEFLSVVSHDDLGNKVMKLLELLIVDFCLIILTILECLQNYYSLNI